MTLSIAALRQQIAEDLLTAHPADAAHFRRVAIEPELVPIDGDPRHERVWVVALAGGEALFYDDVEGGFNVSPLVNGKLTKPGYSQDPLGGAIHHWTSLSRRGDTA
jgi:hypothetical protein